MRPPFAGHGGQLLNRSLATTTKKYFLQRNQYFFEPSPWHTEEPAPAQTSRAPPYSPHRLSIEGIGSRTTVSVRMKSLFWEYLGQSGVFVGNKTKGGGGRRRTGPTVHTQTGLDEESLALSILIRQGVSHEETLVHNLLRGVYCAESLLWNLFRGVSRELLGGVSCEARSLLRGEEKGEGRTPLTYGQWGGHEQIGLLGDI